MVVTSSKATPARGLGLVHVTSTRSTRESARQASAMSLGEGLDEAHGLDPRSTRRREPRPRRSRRCLQGRRWRPPAGCRRAAPRRRRTSARRASRARTTRGARAPEGHEGRPGRCSSALPRTPSRGDRTASRLPATSWTRTHHTPAFAAMAETASVAESRASIDRGSTRRGSASSSPRNRLRDAPMSSGRPERRRARARCASSAQLCSAFLAKPRPGSSTMRAGSMPAATAASSRARSSRAHVAHDVVVDARASSSCRCGRASASRRNGTRSAATRRASRWSASPPLTSLTRHARRPRRRPQPSSARMVSMLTATPAATSPRTTGRTRALLLLGRDPLGARPRRLAADVDEISPGLGQRERRAPRRVGVEVAAAVGERVGRDVEDAHDDGASRCLGGQAAGGARATSRRRAYGRAAHRAQRPTMRLIASARVAGSRSWPRTAEVTVRHRLADPAHGHAQVLALDDHDDARAAAACAPARRRSGWSAAPAPAGAWRRRRPAGRASTAR